MVLGSSPVAVTSPSDFAPASSKEFLDIQATQTIECGFTLKRVRDMTRTYSCIVVLSYCKCWYRKKVLACSSAQIPTEKLYFILSFTKHCIAKCDVKSKGVLFKRPSLGIVYKINKHILKRK